VGKEEGYHTLNQEKINKLLLEYAQKRDVVVRLKGGDPSPLEGEERRGSFLLNMA
jgi:siroheme synthase